MFHVISNVTLWSFTSYRSLHDYILMSTTYGRKFSFNRVQFKQTNNKYGIHMVDYCKQNNRCHHDN